MYLVSYILLELLRCKSEGNINLKVNVVQSNNVANKVDRVTIIADFLTEKCNNNKQLIFGKIAVKLNTVSN